VLDMEFKCLKWKKRSVGHPRVKWWKLTKENIVKLSERITEEGALRQVEDVYTMWEAMAGCIRRSAKEILGTTRKGGNKMKGAWWWNGEVKEKVKEKKEAYATLVNCGTDEEKEISRVRYKATKKVAKKAVAVAKSMAYNRYIKNWRRRRVRRKSLNWQGLGKKELGTWVS